MFFVNCHSVDELKKEFRRLAFIHHPDKGGSNEAMQALNTEFTSRLSYITTSASQDDVNYDAETETTIGEMYRDVIEKIIHLPNIKVEICGSWIWVSGETKPVHNALKNAGLWWASKKEKWYWKPPEQPRKHRRKPMSMSWIRQRYGSVNIEPEIAQQMR